MAFRSRPFKGKRVFADEGAIEALQFGNTFRRQPRVRECSLMKKRLRPFLDPAPPAPIDKRKRVFADEEAIETAVGRSHRFPLRDVRECSLMKKRLRRHNWSKGGRNRINVRECSLMKKRL